jgi:hypothetical protein
MRRLMLLVLSLSLVLSLATACAALSSLSAQGNTGQAGALAKVQAGAAYLSASLANVRQAVAEARDCAPELAAAIEAEVAPALETLQSEVAAYTAAVSASDTAAADAQWPRARASLTTVLGVVAHILTSMLGG